MSFNIANSITVQIGDIKYLVKYPTVGQLIDIENKKMLLTSNQYPQYVGMPQKTVALNYIIDLVDAISHFSVLVPDLLKNLDAKSYFDIDPILSKEIVKVFKTDFRPWYEELMKEIHQGILRSDEN